ncbi:unnamed protein product [Effrenium voratum]|nr:unnamed protein product [Effrenium voratum]
MYAAPMQIAPSFGTPRVQRMHSHCVPAQTPKPVLRQVMSPASEVSRSLSRLLVAWQQAYRGLQSVAAGAPAESAVDSALSAMSAELKNWQLSHPPQNCQLLFCFPRARIGRELHQLLQQGVASSCKPRFMQCAARTASRLHEMALTPQEEKMWQMFTTFQVEDSEPGVLGSEESFGKHLHVRGTTGPIHLMQDWEWPYMFALADAGFQIAAQNVLQKGERKLRILEIGWGQGISGRRLMNNAEEAGLGLEVHYEVAELHPRVAADARREAAKRTQAEVRSVHVHEGPWQKILPSLPAESYDLIFYDPLNISPRYIGEKQLFEQWGLPTCIFEALQFYRLLAPGGVLVQYAISHRTSTVDLLRRQLQPLFRELRLTRISGLRAEANSSYVTTAEAADLFAPALIK